MSTSLQVGISHISELTVEKGHTASSYGSGLLEVYATPSMIALMENAAMMAVQHCLPAGHGTVGIEISVKHIKATPIGVRVKSEATLTAIDERKLTFSLKAWDEQGEIGHGTHVRFIIDNEKFMKKVKGFG